jgi:hypothetical protein
MHSQKELEFLEMKRMNKLHLQGRQKNHFQIKQEILNQLMSLHHGMIKQELKEK